MKSVLCIVFLTTAGIALAQSQTTKTQPSAPAKKPSALTRNNPTHQLPFAVARDMTVIISRLPPSQPPEPGMPPISLGRPMAIGSGAWIGKHGYVVTCWHVIAPSPDSIAIGIAREPYVTEEGKFNLSITGGTSLIRVKLEAYDVDTDLAILKADKSPDEVLLVPTVVFLGPGAPPASLTPQVPLSPKGGALKTEVPQLGDTLLLAGFPLGKDTLVLQTGVATGFYSNQLTPNGPPASALRIMLSLVSNPGNSGGPVLDVNGKIIGLEEGNLLSYVRSDELGVAFCSWKKFDNNGQPLEAVQAPCLQNSGISYAVPAKFVADLARKHNINLD